MMARMVTGEVVEQSMQVSRAVSAMVNHLDDWGVLEGSWLVQVKPLFRWISRQGDPTFDFNYSGLAVTKMARHPQIGKAVQG